MKKAIPILISIVMLVTSTSLFAAEGRNTGNVSNLSIKNRSSTPAPAIKSPGPVETAKQLPPRSSTIAPKKTIFTHLSDYFSMFDRSFKRPGNKQGFFDATADWLRHVDKY